MHTDWEGRNKTVFADDIVYEENLNQHHQKLLEQIRNYSKISGHMFNMCCAVLSSSVVFDSATPWTVAHQVPLSMGILHARILEWVAIPFSRQFSQPSDQTQVSLIAGRFFTIWATREAWFNIRKSIIFEYISTEKVKCGMHKAIWLSIQRNEIVRYKCNKICVRST